MVSVDSRREEIEGLAAELMGCLDELIEAFRKLLRLAEEKQQRIMRRDGPGLVSLVEQQAEAAEQLGRLEERRAQLAERAGWEGNASQWVAELPAPLRQQADAKLATLRELADRLSHQHAVNERLLEEELAYIRFALDVLEGPQAEDVTYGPDAGEGRSATGAKRSLFDFKA